MPYSIKLLEFAHILCKNSVLLKGGDEKQTTTIGCFAFLLQNNDEYILIDTGIENIEVVNTTKSSKDNWSRCETEFDLIENLNIVGVKPEQITKVLITHCHYDHLSGICHLANADIFINKTELDFLLSEGNPHKNVLTEQIDFIKNRNVITMDDNYKVNNDILAIKVGGHTPGSTMYKINTKNGKAIFTGDNVFLLDNIQKGVQIGFSLNEREARRAVDICKKFKGTVITSHDLKCKEVIKHV